MNRAVSHQRLKVLMFERKAEGDWVMVQDGLQIPLCVREIQVSVNPGTHMWKTLSKRPAM